MGYLFLKSSYDTINHMNNSILFCFINVILQQYTEIQDIYHKKKHHLIIISQ